MAGVALLFVQEVRQAGGSSGEVLTGLGLVLVAVLAASLSNVMQIMPAVKAHSRSRRCSAGRCSTARRSTPPSPSPSSGRRSMDPRPGYWLGLLYLGLIASALAFWLYFEIIRKVGPAKAAYSSVLIPIIAMAFSTALEGYRWSALAIAGGAAHHRRPRHRAPLRPPRAGAAADRMSRGTTSPPARWRRAERGRIHAAQDRRRSRLSFPERGRGAADARGRAAARPAADRGPADRERLRAAPPDHRRGRDRAADLGGDRGIVPRPLYRDRRCRARARRRSRASPPTRSRRCPPRSSPISGRAAIARRTGSRRSSSGSSKS